MSSKTVRQMQALQKKLERFKSETAKAEGAIEQLTATLEKEFDCASLEEGQTLLDQLEAEEDELKESLETMYDEFSNKWRDTLEGRGPKASNEEGDGVDED